MSQQYTAAIISIIAVAAPKFGLVIGTDELTSLVSAVVTIVAGIWIMYRRYKQGDITLAGSRKS